jgi:hypothetical protein
MDMHCRKSKRKSFKFFFFAINCVNTVLLSTYSANAQSTISPLDNLPLSDLTGFSFQQPVGPRFEVDLPDGTRCVSQDGTPTTMNLFSGLSERVDEIEKNELMSGYSGNGNGYAFGAVLTVPFGTKNSRNCDQAYAISIVSKKIELAQLLHEEGLLSDADLAALLNKVKSILLSDD